MKTPIAPSRPASRRLLHLDVVRGVAILLVLLYHTCFPVVRPSWYQPVKWVAGSGWAGVDLFFVLSGFLIGGLLLGERERRGTIDSGRFLIRRAFKTLPTYYVFLATFAVTYVVFATKWGATPEARFQELASDLWPTLIHCQNYFPRTAERLGWLWSLAVEEHFYLLLAVVLSALSRRNPDAGSARIPGFWWLFVFVVIGSTVARALNSVTLNSPSGASHLRFDSLFFGVALAYLTRLYVDRLKSLRRFRFMFLAMGGALFFLHRLSSAHHSDFLFPFGQTVLAIAGTLLVLAAFLSDKSDERAAPSSSSPVQLALRGIAWVGIRSYSIYVWHGWFSRPIANRLTEGTVIDPQNAGITGIIGEAVFLSVPIVLGTLSYQFIELPFIALRERWFGHRPEFKPAGISAAVGLGKNR